MAVHHPGMKQEISDLMHTIRQMVTQAMQNASFGSAGLRVYDGGWITIENGGLSITGTAKVSGKLGGDGTFDWTGPWYLKGKGEITGDTDITGKLKATGDTEFGGNTSIKKKLDVTAETRLRGKTTIEADLEVTSAGKIKVGDMTIEPRAGGGRVTFANGATITADGSGASLSHGVSKVFIDEQRASLMRGGTSLTVTNGEIHASGMAAFRDASLPEGVLRTNMIGRLERNTL
ncbi:hypothetical protein [Leucobacter chinensis]|uniref:hypothetical protein n=1 Tax=Leucobacter chinensis TaxID=2851010 RepID=UPI001C237B93|nr:hypothetical protein [Leucobacter chinensis]